MPARNERKVKFDIKVATKAIGGMTVPQLKSLLKKTDCRQMGRRRSWSRGSLRLRLLSHRRRTRIRSRRRAPR